MAASLRSRRKHKAWGGARLGSETPGQDGKRIPAREAGGRHVSCISCRPRRGLAYIIRMVLGFRSQSLAPPQALCLRLLRRLQELGAVATALRNLRISLVIKQHLSAGPAKLFELRIPRSDNIPGGVATLNTIKRV